MQGEWKNKRDVHASKRVKLTYDDLGAIAGSRDEWVKSLRDETAAVDIGQ
jgi:hypothetical protein